MTTTRVATYRDLEPFLDGATRMTVERLRDLDIVEGYPQLPYKWASAREMADALLYLAFDDAADDIDAKLELYELLMDYTPERR